MCIYEAWDHWKVRGGALGLAAGARILRRLGLGDQLAAVANQVGVPHNSWTVGHGKSQLKKTWMILGVPKEMYRYGS